MIVVVGEALMDLVVTADGQIAARPGGGPYNAARTMARLGAPTVFAGRLANDSFGRLLRGVLADDGVALGLPQPAAAPTPLAVAETDAAGFATYVFYLAGTAAADSEYPVLLAAMPDGLSAVHVGSLGLVFEPMAVSVERLITRGVPPDVMMMVDPNCRPAAIGNRQAYLDRLDRILRRADVVKVSKEDLGFLYPGSATEAAAATLLGDKSALVIVTDGPRPVRAFLPGGSLLVEVHPTPVVDTIGAGDAFGGAFLAWWTENGLTRNDITCPRLVQDALRAAVAVASLTCTRAGACPPTLAEVRALDGWPKAVR